VAHSPIQRTLSGSLILAATGFGAWRIWVAFRWLRLWLRWRLADPSAAELYLDGVWLNLVAAVASAVVAGFGLVIRRKTSEEPSASTRPGTGH
jgi:hypothetical protein